MSASAVGESPSAFAAQRRAANRRVKSAELEKKRVTAFEDNALKMARAAQSKMEQMLQRLAAQKNKTEHRANRSRDRLARVKARMGAEQKRLEHELAKTKLDSTVQEQHQQTKLQLDAEKAKHQQHEVQRLKRKLVTARIAAQHEAARHDLQLKKKLRRAIMKESALVLKGHRLQATITKHKSAVQVWRKQKQEMRKKIRWPPEPCQN